MIMLTHERLVEILNYDPATGAFSWKVRKGSRAASGAKCSNVDPDGYSKIRVDRKLYRASRLAWFYYYGSWPEKLIDHINGQRDDDRIENLRSATSSQNSMNAKKHIGPKRGRTSVFKGVSYDKINKKWRACINKERKFINLGRFETEQEARAAYCEAAIHLHGEFRRTA